jgi:hypothetical protein
MPTAGSGVVQTMTPVHGDIMVFAPGSCGADSMTGHVAVVDVVGTKVSAVQQNTASRTSYAASCAKCYLHVVANDGSMGAAGAGGAANGGAPGTASGGTTAAGGASSGAGGFPPFGAGGFPPFGAGGAPGISGAPSLPMGTAGVPSMTSPGGVAGMASTTSASTGGYPPTVVGSGTGGVVSAPAASGGYAGASTYGTGVAGAASSLDFGNDGGTSCNVGGVGSTRDSGGATLLAIALGLLFKRRRS